jgi:hypothetical protein
MIDGFFDSVTDPVQALRDAVNAPFEVLRDLALGSLCGDPDRIADGIFGYGMLVASGGEGWNSAVDAGWGLRRPRLRDALDEEGDPALSRLGCAGANSFSADTLVSTEDGLRPIDEIVVGDRVWAYNEATGTTGLYTVTAVLVHDDPVEVQLHIGGEQISTTPEHPFFTLELGWVDAGDLWRGAHIRRADGSFALLWDFTVDARPRRMYNLTVATAHTFFVGVQRVLVHNAHRCFPGRRPVSPQGARLADIASNLFTNSELQFYEKLHTTIAVAEHDGKIYVTVNGGADKRAIPKIQKAVEDMGGEFLPNSGGKKSHAEVYLYEYLQKQVTDIGISHSGGPCKPICRPYFLNQVGVEITYDNEWK